MRKFLVLVTLIVLSTTMFILLLSCGKKKNPVSPRVISAELQAEIDRITPLLYWCDGLPSGSGSNNIDGRPNCDTGDGWAEAGFITLVGNLPNNQTIFNALKSSFSAEGQPFRSPSYVDKDTSNEFSRDQFLGSINASIAGMPAEDGLSRILAYEESTGSLCPNPKGPGCWLNPEMKILSKYALGQNVTVVEKGILESTLNIEAGSVPLNYQAGLVSYQIYALTRMGKLTTSYAKAAATLHKRSPLNLWFSTLYGITNNGSQEFFDDIATRLTECMRTWVSPGIDWSWSYTEECHASKSVGHELVAVARLLLRVEQGMELPQAPIQ